MCNAQSDTLNGFNNRIIGEEINYSSPLHLFAPKAVLTRALGNMPVKISAPLATNKSGTITYFFLVGFSTGTSSAERDFDFFINDKFISTFKTPLKKKGKFNLKFDDNNYHIFFESIDYDVNNDVFGKLYITVSANEVLQNAVFKVEGKNANSRDWLMVFDYKRGVKVSSQALNLITRAEQKKILNIEIDNPYLDNTVLQIISKDVSKIVKVKNGYNNISIPFFDANKTGIETIDFILNKKDTVVNTIKLSTTKPFEFCLIHHSHNDIGYSHLQTEVEEIQNRNILTAINWVEKKHSVAKACWHIESLWAVENFLKVASANNKNKFSNAVKTGKIVLSANYVNMLSGLCKEKELNWVLEYSKILNKQYGFKFSNAMITDVPGITYNGLLSYVNNNIPYLSLGPNYVDAFPDKGGRVGGVISEQGDKMFYWKPSSSSTQKLLVWTAGKGYSFFHGIAENSKQQAWEKRISTYCDELVAKK
jgi:hypothetical protein